MADMNATEAGSSLGQTPQSHRAAARPTLPLWVPPVCAVMFGAAVVLQDPDDAMPGLTAPLIGLALALGAYALVAGIRARQGTRRRVSPGAWIGAVVGAATFSASSLNSSSTSGLGWVYLAAGVGVAGIVWCRLHRNGRVVDRS